MILDTSFLIAVLRGDSGVESWESKLEEAGGGTVTPISVMELWEGIHRSKSSKTEREEVKRLLTGLNEAPFNRAAAMRAGEISAKLTANGNTIDIEDIMIGAVALERNCPVLTGNPKHFNRIPDLVVESY